MKKVLFILGGVFFLLFVFTFAFMWWLIDALTIERNGNKTKNARAARWTKPADNGHAEPEDLKEMETTQTNSHEDQEKK